MSKKIVINRCHGGFGLSYSGVLKYCELAGLEVWSEEDRNYSGLSPNYWLIGPGPERVNINVPSEEWVKMTLEERREFNAKCDQQLFNYRGIRRDDPLLVKTVEEIGLDANGKYAELKVVEIPDDVEWVIEEYDGLEWVAEVHRTWR